MASGDFPIATLNPRRSADGARTSIIVDVDGHRFQAVFVCLPTGALSDPAIHGSRSDRMTPERRIELESEARFKAMQIKEVHGIELAAGMSVVTVDDLLRCVSRAPKEPELGSVHHLDDWDALTGADAARTPPLARPVLSAAAWQEENSWLFWGTLDLKVGLPGDDQPGLEQRLAKQLGAKHVQIRHLWLGRPEVLAVF